MNSIMTQSKSVKNTQGTVKFAHFKWLLVHLESSTYFNMYFKVLLTNEFDRKKYLFVNLAKMIITIYAEGGTLLYKRLGLN